VWNNREREAGSNGNAFGPTNLLSINTQSAPCSLFNSTSTAVGGFSGANYNNLYFYAGGGGGASSLMAHGGSTHLAAGGDFGPWKSSSLGYGAGSAGADAYIINQTGYNSFTTEFLQSGGPGAIWIYYLPLANICEQSTIKHIDTVLSETQPTCTT
jgi:hypothetical protein